MSELKIGYARVSTEWALFPVPTAPSSRLQGLYGDGECMEWRYVEPPP